MSTHLDVGYSKSPIFKDIKVLDRNYIPDHFKLREEERKKIEGRIGKHMRSGVGRHLLVWGPPGTGKTHILKRTKIVTRDWYKKRNINGNIIYMNCKGKTFYRIFVNIIQKFVNYPSTGKSTGQVIDDFIRRLAESNRKTVIIFDEADKVRSTPWASENPIDDLIYHTTRVREYNDNVELMIILVANDSSIHSKLKSYNRSTFENEKVFFSPYNADEISTILKERCDMAFKDGIIKGSAISLASALVTEAGGQDLRDAFDWLKIAGEIYEELETDKKIDEDLIYKAKNIAERDECRDTIEGLSIQEFHTLAAVILSKKDNVSTKQVYDNYKKLIKWTGLDPKSYDYLRKYILPTLDSQGLVKSDVKGRGKGKGVTGYFYPGNRKIKKIIQKVIKDKDEYNSLEKQISKTIKDKN